MARRVLGRVVRRLSANVERPQGQFVPELMQMPGSQQWFWLPLH